MRNGLWSFLAFLTAGAFLAVLFRPEGATSRPTPPTARRAMPELRLPVLDGGAWSLPERRGQVVLVNYWASWCPPCREETPGLVRVADDFRGKGLEVAGVSLDEDLDSVRRFSRQFRVSYPLLLPKGDPVASNIESLPTTYLIDRQGRVANIFVGAVSEATLREAVGNLLSERL